MKKGEQAKDITIQNFPYLPKNYTVRKVEKKLEEKSYEDIDYIYVKDKNNKLCGVLSIKELFKQHKNTKLETFMKTKVFAVNADEDQEDVVKLAMDKDIKSVPVTKKGVLIGVVAHHKILDILHEEGIEDMLFSAGIEKFSSPAEEIIHASTKTHIKKRLPWLLLGLTGGVLAALTVGLFEDMLEVYVILAAFMPAVVYMADAIGNQTQTILIRSMALEELKIKEYILREFKVNTVLAAVLGSVFYVVVSIIWQDNFFASIIGLAIFATTLTAVLVGVGLPWFFDKMQYDPAVSTGPFSTAIIDLSSLIIYFVIAQTMITYLL